MKKLYLLLFVTSLFSLAIAVILKLCGVGWFDNAPISAESATALGISVNMFINTLQCFLIFGCMTWIKPKILIYKYIPFIPLNVLLFFVPEKYYFVSCLIILFLMCFSANPKFSFIIKFVYGLFAVSLIQQASIWVKYGLLGINSTGLSLRTIIEGNVDQFILFALLYYFNVKCGEKHGLPLLAIFRKDK